MIRVENLKKQFGTTKAVDGISFEIPKGQLVGFLGPNGAGKTTTMRLLTGYLPIDEGEASLMGHDLMGETLEVRRRLGYLPENNPLPDDIEVTDYLHFVGKLRGIKNISERHEKICHVLKVCSLKSVIGKKLGELSKGFRQRVGLAQAIIHNPDVLILDEPTSGLDPNQVQEVRELIQDLKKEKTLLLSTHILSEVQHACDRVLIINGGKIVGDGTPSSLSGDMQSGHRLAVEFKGDYKKIESELTKVKGVQKVLRRRLDASSNEEFLIESEAGVDLREDIFKLASSKNWPIMGMRVDRLSLEDVFRSLTKDA